MTEDGTSALLRALTTKFPGLRVSFEEIVSRSWASATFVGARHEIGFIVDGDGAAPAAQAFVACLGEEEFALRGHLVADIAPVSSEIATDRARIAIEALTVEDN